MEIRIDAVAGPEQADLWLALRNRIALEPLPAGQRARLREMSPDTVELLALLDGEPVAAAHVGTALAEPRARHAGAGAHVLPEARGKGIGRALYAEVSERARGLGKDELEVTAPAADEPSLGFLRRRGFREVTRSQQASLELAGTAAAAPSAAPHASGLEIVTLAARPDTAAGMYEVAREAIPDIPVSEPLEAGTEEEWREEEITHSLPELTVAALVAGEVVGYSTLGDFGDGAALHLMTGVRRSWRSRGVARALKAAQIELARSAGVSRLVAFNDATNAPMQRLNVALGYRLHPVYATFRGPLAGG
jgi:GNAT superfamily N-acetyltransferase